MATKRGAEEDGGDENPSKRRRVEEEHTFAMPSSLDDINNDCVLLILKYLSAENLNSVAICNRRYREVRSHESLDQARTGTIVCSENTTPVYVRRAFVSQQWHHVFTGNRTRLKVVGLERTQRAQVYRRPPEVLPLVSSLDISVNPLDGNGDTHENPSMLAFVNMLPNLDEIDLSYVQVHPYFLKNTIFDRYRQLRRVIWNGSSHQVGMDGGTFHRCSKTLTELYLDNSRLEASYAPAFSMEENQSPSATCIFLFRHCSCVERLGIKNATWACFEADVSNRLSQDMLIKMVRHHPTLRWLRSVLTAENIAMLQRERPDITFVSD